MTEEQWEGLLEHIGQGGSTKSFCDANKIRQGAIYERIGSDSTFAEKYAHAKANGIESRIDAAQEVARTEPDVQRARLIVDLAKWEASKLLPKRYGDSLDLTSKGESIQPLMVAVDPKKMFPETPEE